MLKSKLDPKKYPCLPIEEVIKKIDFATNVDPKQLDPIFLGRYAALCVRLGVRGKIISGKRNHERQIQLYIADGGHQNSDGTWSGGTGYVARPGGSWHEYAIAIDSGDKVVKELENDRATGQQVLLKAYGLFKPLTKGNGCRVLEDWHIQPIETLGVTKKETLEPINTNAIKKGDFGQEVKEIQEKLQKKGYPIKFVDGDFGEKTENAVKLFQRNNGLKDDGIVGNLTLDKLK